MTQRLRSSSTIIDSRHQNLLVSVDSFQHSKGALTGTVGVFMLQMQSSVVEDVEGVVVTKFVQETEETKVLAFVSTGKVGFAGSNDTVGNWLIEQRH